MAKINQPNLDNFFAAFSSIGLKIFIAPALTITILSLLLREVLTPLKIFFPFITLLLVIAFSLSLGIVIRLEFRKKGIKIICGLFIAVTAIMLITHFVCQCLSGFSLFLAAATPFYIYAGAEFGQILKTR